MKNLKKLSILKLEKKATKEIMGGFCSKCSTSSGCSCSSSQMNKAFGSGYNYNRANDIFNN